MDQPDHTPAELDRRFYAFAIDRAIAWGLMTAVGYVAYVRYLDDDQVGVGIGVIAGGVVAISLVFAVVLGLTGVSPGKALVGLRVVRASDGRPIGVPHAVLRTAVLGMFTVPTTGIGLATLAFTAVMDPGGWRRGGHDRMTDAVVVDARPVPQAEPDGDAPPQIVNLTAMRLMPAPANPPLPAPAPIADPPPVTAPDSPPPARRREQRLPPPPP
ncbi:MAG: RDD family protein, partial [Nocardioides sp.]